MITFDTAFEILAHFTAVKLLSEVQEKRQMYAKSYYLLHPYVIVGSRVVRETNVEHKYRHHRINNHSKNFQNQAVCKNFGTILDVSTHFMY